MGEAGSSQAHDGGLDEGEHSEVMDSVHGDGVGLSSFGADEGGQAFTYDGGFPMNAPLFKVMSKHLVVRVGSSLCNLSTLYCRALCFLRVMEDLDC